MKISEMELDELYALSSQEKLDFFLREAQDDGAYRKVVLLLGSKPQNAICRAHAAADLYLAGRVSYIVPSGGVTWEHEGRRLSECELMTEVLMARGVPADAIIPENEATTTKENMIYATLRINRALKFKGIKEVLIITSFWHMKRSLALAKALFPRFVTPCGYAADIPEREDEYLAKEENIQRLDGELRLLKGLVSGGWTEDFDIKG